jgi:cephalosporin hydroxylase
MCVTLADEAVALPFSKAVLRYILPHNLDASREFTKMTDPYCQIASHTWLFTSHGTVIFVDTTSGELRHGPLSNPPNVVLVREGERARLKFVGTDGPQEIACGLEYSAIVRSNSQRSSETAATVGSEFTYVPTNGEEFGLTEHGRFLSAEPGGRITLSRTTCQAWESFFLRTEASGTLAERIRWSPVHGASLQVGDDGLLTLRDGRTFDWHLLRWTDPRLDGTLVRLIVVAKPAPACSTNLYIHHWGGKDVCGIDKSGAIAFNDGAEKIQIEHRADGFFTATIIFENRHPTLSLGTGNPRGQYQGTGADQYFLKCLEVELLPLNPIRQSLIERIWRGNDPFGSFPRNLFGHDLQGWNSQHPYLAEAIGVVRPAVILEVGVWKGGSTVFMANELRKRALKSVIIAVDTWLGASDHWTTQYFTDLNLVNGYPSLYNKFMSNVIYSGVVEFVLPLPIDSLNAAEILRLQDVRPAMIHLDGGHDYESVLADLRAWWPLLTPGGILVGDDYWASGTFQGVRKAFDDFFGPLGLAPIENVSGKCRVRKARDIMTAVSDSVP